jgi:hypothetical protein
VSEAQYITVIARGTGWTEDYIRWQLPLSRGRAYAHALRLMDGEAMMWPDRRLSETGRWWDRARTRFSPGGRAEIVVLREKLV